MTTQGKGLLKPTLQITALSFIGIIFSFVSQLIIAYYFGASTGRDAYFAAIAIPTYITAIFTGSLGIVFLPKVIDIINNNNPQIVRKFISNTLGSTSFLLVFLILLGILFSEKILELTTPGFSDEMTSYTGSILRILLPSSLFAVLTNLISYLYQIKRNFVRPATIPIISVVINIISVIVLSPYIGIKSLAIGTLIGSIISFLLVIPILFTVQFKFILHFGFFDKNFVSIIKVALPLFLGGFIFRSTPVLERMIASGLAPGSISILGYSGQFINIIATIATSGIAISFFPSMSDAWSKDIGLFIQFFNRGIRGILLLVMPIASSFVLFGNVIIKILLQRGAFTPMDTLAVSEAFTYMTPALIVLSLGGIINKAFYISKRTIDLTIIGICELLSYFFLSYYLSRNMGYLGIALGMSISYSLFLLIYFFYATEIIIKEYNYKLIVYDILQIIISTIISFSFSKIFFNLIKSNMNEYVAVATSLFFASCLYLFLLFKFKNEEIITLIHKLKKS